MKGKDFLSITDFSPAELQELVSGALRAKREESERLLEGKVVALLFEKPSLRTRVSFEVGIRQLGGECIYLGKEDVGLGVREPAADVARVLDRWVDAIVARVSSHQTLEILAQHAGVPVINALSDLEHPCQAVTDLVTVLEMKERTSSIRVAFVGDGNNVATSLALACSSVGASFVHASPAAYQIPGQAWEESKRRASLHQSRVSWVELPQQAVRDADVVYTDVWVSMGHEGKDSERLDAFVDYQVNPDLMSYAKPDAIFMHDLPAHRGQEISDGMLDHPRSVVFQQAENRLHAQKAILARLFS